MISRFLFIQKRYLKNECRKYVITGAAWDIMPGIPGWGK